MKAIVVTDQNAGPAGMRLMERPEPQAAINDVVVEVHAAGFVNTELEWPSTWADRAFHDRTPSILGHELAGVVTALGYGTTGLSIGQRVFGLSDWHRDGTLAEYIAMEARNLAPLPGDVDFTVGASLPISGLTAWQGLFQHGRQRTPKVGDHRGVSALQIVVPVCGIGTWPAGFQERRELAGHFHQRGVQGFRMDRRGVGPMGDHHLPSVDRLQQ